MSDYDTTVKLLNLPTSRRVVATFAGMADLSAFDSQPDKLAALCDALATIDCVAPELDKYSLGTIQNAARLVRAFIDRDGG